MKENRQTIMPRPLIAVMIVMLGIALLPTNKVNKGV